MKITTSVSAILLAVCVFGFQGICSGQQTYVVDVEITHSVGGAGVRGIGGGDNATGSKETELLYMLEAELDAGKKADEWVLQEWATQPENLNKIILGIQQSENCPGNVVANWHAGEGVWEYFMYIVSIRYQIDED